MLRRKRCRWIIILAVVLIAPLAGILWSHSKVSKEVIWSASKMLDAAFLPAQVTTEWILPTEFPLTQQVASQYAYAFVIGGCDPEKQNYLGFVYNIIVSARRLRQEGAQADVVAFFQISHQSPAETLAAEDIRILTAMGVKIHYLRKSNAESFYDTVLNKFEILGLTGYRRVLLMDSTSCLYRISIISFIYPRWAFLRRISW